MKQEEAEQRLLFHQPLTKLIFGIKTSDGEFRLDACACISEEDFEKEKKAFFKYRVFKMEEIK